MTQPDQNLGQAARNLPRRQGGPVDQDDRQAKLLGRVNLGPRPTAARILGDDMADALGGQQIQIPLQGERSPRNHRLAIGQRQPFGRIDQAQQVMMLGLCGKGGKVLLADRQKHPRRGLWQGRDGSVNIGDRLAAGKAAPGRTFKPQQRQAQGRTSGNGISAHLGGKGMGGVNDMGDLFGREPGHKPPNPAKAANAGGQGLRHRAVGASGIGKHRVHLTVGQAAGKGAGLGSAAQKKDALHV